MTKKRKKSRQTVFIFSCASSPEKKRKGREKKGTTKLKNNRKVANSSPHLSQKCDWRYTPDPSMLSFQKNINEESLPLRSKEMHFQPLRHCFFLPYQI